ELGGRDPGEKGVRGLAGRQSQRGGRDALALRRRHQTRELGQKRSQGLVDAVTRCGIVAQGRLDPRLRLERDGDALVERQGASGDRSPFCCWGGRGLRRGAFGREQDEKECERHSRKREPLHTAPENITPVDRRWMAGVYLFS